MEHTKRQVLTALPSK